MKKVIGTFILGAGLAASLSASAAATITTIVSGSSYDETNSCILLSEAVTLNLSKNVKGAFSCDEANNVMKVATCHTAGFRVSGITCSVIGTDTSVTPAAPIYNNGACTAAGEVIPGADYLGFAASSSGGTVGDVFLGGNCDQGKVEALPQLQ